MTTTGPVYPGTTASRDAGAPNPAWTTPNNAQSDNATYTTSLASTDVDTDYLDCTGFGLSIPASDIVDGITAEVERKSSSNTSRWVKDFLVRLLIAGAESGDNKADTTTQWLTTDVVKTYGGAADSWGLALTGADVNASNFGLTFRAKIKYLPSDGAANVTASIDYVRLTITHHSGAKPWAQVITIAEAFRERWERRGRLWLPRSEPIWRPVMTRRAA